MARSLSSHAARRCLLSGIVIASTFAMSHAASLPDVIPTNLERLERVATDLADSLVGDAGSIDTLCLAVVPHDASWLVERAITARAGARALHLRRCEAGDPLRHDVAITSVGVLYRETDDGMLERVASMKWSVTAPVSRPGTRLARFEYGSESIDTVAPRDTAALATFGYPFTSGMASVADSGGFWKKIIEPAVVLAASAIVVILLFTVRSQ